MTFINQRSPTVERMDLGHAMADLRQCSEVKPFALELLPLDQSNIDLLSSQFQCFQHCVESPVPPTAQSKPSVCSRQTVSGPCASTSDDAGESLRLNAGGPAAAAKRKPRARRSNKKKTKQPRSCRPPKLKKSKNQLTILRNYFQKDHKPSRAGLETISQEACLTVNEVQNWFRNQRNRPRKSSSTSRSSPLGEMPLPPMDNSSLQTLGSNYVLSQLEQPLFEEQSLFEEQPLFEVSTENSQGLFEVSGKSANDTARGHALEQLSDLPEPALPIFCTRTLPEKNQLRHFPVENRFLLRFQMLEKDSPERREMLTALISSLSREEKDRFLLAVKSHPQSISADELCLMQPAHQAWECVREIFGIGEAKSVPDQASPDSGVGSSSGHSSDTDSSCLPENVDLFDEKGVFSIEDFLSSHTTHDDIASESCDAEMVYALSNVFKSHREYLHVVCRQLGYTPTERSADSNPGAAVVWQMT